ncbi:hypothetical protein P3S67_022736 [Capsicum chacoense]|uniref:uncharacterized protein LOC107860935 n=1 Tax=Capsicum annuum TaxID=4072 RepID=UPI0007BF1944|nr:uncharacterized protein LOC107860935 [Capsicum annuum]KAF3633390.1 putative mannose-6-phosphate isomerase 2-like [Capsicum annuum]KAF3635176.1 putative mannose-6-phosphate isomerase 2-like [Capsicum annuum]
MAIELCSSDESTLGIMSPARISFSHDVSQTGSVPVEQYIRSTSPSSSIDFDFCVFRESFDLESSSADELFFDGKILPIEIKRRISSAPPRKAEQPLPPPSPPLIPCKNSSTNNTLHCTKTSSHEDIIENKTGILESSEEKLNSKSFWRFKRSSSLNCGSGYARTLCPLPLLSRSNSTGSSPSVKRNSTLSKDNLSHQKHHHSQRHFSKSMSTNGQNCQKPPLKKAPSNPYSNGVKFSPVLNVPPANLFGLSTFFSGSKEKIKKK